MAALEVEKFLAEQEEDTVDEPAERTSSQRTVSVLVLLLLVAALVLGGLYLNTETVDELIAAFQKTLGCNVLF